MPLQERFFQQTVQTARE